MATDARKFYLTTQYPIDNIVFLKSGSMTVPNNTQDGISIAKHNLPFAPLPLLIWSNTPDFAISNTQLDSAWISRIYNTFPPGQNYLIYSTATDIFIQRDNYSGASQTVYYRIYAFAPSTADIESVVPPTVDLGDPFALNTDYDYLKVDKVGKLDYATTSYVHNLGYIPRVMIWARSISGYQPVAFQQIINTDPTGSVGATNGIYVDENKLQWLNPNSFFDIEYRLYRDE